MSIELLSIGTELLIGTTIDTNAAWIAKRLAEEGIEVSRKTTVGDDRRVIRDALEAALQRSRIVVCTGGLGPTRDDVTRDAVAALYGRELRLDPEWLRVVEQRFAARGMEMPPINRVQAEAPEGAELLPNERGTAPGLLIDDATLGTTVLLPGVPSEMRALMDAHVVPRLRERLRPAHPIESRLLRTTGITESALAALIDDVASDVAPLSLAFLPHLSGVDLRLTVPAAAFQADAGFDVDAAFDDATRRLTERCGAWVYSSDGADLAVVVGAMLRRRGLTLALAESCTGGLLSKRLSDEPGASDFLRAAFVTYANAAKRDLIAVSVQTLAMHGAVSERCAREMADGARRMADADVGVSITGIAGPGGGSEAKPVGTVWIAVSHRAATKAKLLRLVGNRAEIRERSAQAALDMLRRTLDDMQNGA